MRSCTMQSAHSTRTCFEGAPPIGSDHRFDPEHTCVACTCKRTCCHMHGGAPTKPNHIHKTYTCGCAYACVQGTHLCPGCRSIKQRWWHRKRRQHVLHRPHRGCGPWPTAVGSEEVQGRDGKGGVDVKDGAGEGGKGGDEPTAQTANAGGGVGAALVNASPAGSGYGGASDASPSPCTASTCT